MKNRWVKCEGVTVEPQTEAAFRDAELVVISPGVPADLRSARDVRARGVPVIGELELAAPFLEGRNIGITGTNGKTTTTALTGHILRESGIACQVGGNIGTAPAAMVDTSRPDQWNVLELSSFQLETIETFRAPIAACLNVTQNHLDRHHTFENYVNAKARLFETQRAGRSRGSECGRSGHGRLRQAHARPRRSGSAARTRFPARGWTAT